MKKVITLIGVISGFVGFSQQIPLSSLYTYNFYSINPAEAVHNKDFEFNCGHRQQWIDFEGAPVTTYFTGAGQIQGNMGIGLSVNMDKIAFLERTAFSASYAYELNLDDHSYLSFGLALGGVQGKLNLNNVIATDMDDAILLNPEQTGFGFDAQFGISYNKDGKVHLGVSFPQMLNTKANWNNPNMESAYDLTRHSYAYASFDLDVDEGIVLQPTFMLRGSKNISPQIDLMANLNFQDKFWAGLGMRQGAGILVNVGGNMKDVFRISYGYGVANKYFSANTSGTHELMLTYRLGSKVSSTEEEASAEATESAE